MLVLIKGAGDLATGVAHRLKIAGFNIVMTEIEKPTTVRRTVAFSQAIYDKCTEVEGVKALLVNNLDEAYKTISNGMIPVLIDEKCNILKDIKPDVIIDAIVAKKNLGTQIDDARCVIALGPSFEAGVDCHAVVETKRGHFLGKVLYKGSAIPNTGIPGEIGGFTEERIIRSVSDGIFIATVNIGDYVKKGQVIAYVDSREIYASITGVVRGILQNNISVTKGMKCGDIDPRCAVRHCFTISDKARSIGGGVLEAILHFTMKKGISEEVK